ncbi:MAG TPA: hypothetical protein VLX90_13125 [Steroidobacteraceae bacterium]|nr:hypothetical protein [Steroidobacteraceae bacterium]
MYTPRRFILILALFVIGRALAAEPWPQIPSPPHATVLAWVGDDMRINGIPTRVLKFHSRDPRTTVIEYYRSFWTGGYAVKAIVKPLGSSATVVSQRHGPYFMMVKAQDLSDGSSEGLISVARIAGSKVKMDAGDLPLIPGAHVVSVVESADPGKHSREVVVLAQQPPTSVAQFYQASFTNAGWHQVQATEGNASRGAASFVVFARQDSEMQLAIAPVANGRATTLVANLVTKDTGRNLF